MNWSIVGFEGYSLCNLNSLACLDITLDYARSS